MSSYRLDLLIRKNKGKSLLSKYKEMFVCTGVQETDLKYVNLDESDKILHDIRTIFPEVHEQVEILSENCTFLDSELLTLIFANLSSLDQCYMFSDDVYYCGMYIADAKSVQACCLNVAKTGYSNTCFLLDKELRFSFTINYYKEGDAELKNKFDIHLKSLMSYLDLLHLNRHGVNGFTYLNRNYVTTKKNIPEGVQADEC